MKTSHSLSEDVPEPQSLSKLDANGLRLELFRQRDRYHHRIVAADGTLLLTSIEGTDQDDWPPSPPLQQLSIEEIRPGVEVALLVGMAGKSHWSVSIELQDDQLGFIFDVACRSSDAAGWFGSSYEFHKSEPQGLEMIGLSVEGQTTLVEAAVQRWVAAPNADLPAGRTSTVRWKYALSLARRS